MSKKTKISAYKEGVRLQRYLETCLESETDIEQYLKNRTITIVKQDRESYSAIVDINEIDIKRVFLKVYQRKTWKRKIQYLFGHRRAYRSWQAHCHFCDMALAVPAPMVYVANGSSEFVLSEFKNGLVDLRMFIGDKHMNTTFAESGIMTKAAELIAAIHQSGYVHGDCKWGNFLWSDADKALYVVDFDGAKPYHDKQATKDVARFIVSAKEAKTKEKLLSEFMTCYGDIMKVDVDFLIKKISPVVNRIILRHKSK